ncbi:MAG TPA: hypothetical protein ENG63_09590 [Candidatus Desulfofervidus auxilii]|uniref:Uncharacterized protein n=1 Tax=Desulfofervidus auxilii TaxID=1621989 RepID=A0A7C0YB79_DESA2|nr:MAG: hypothetical protein DRP58_02595 [Spirochaetota bacterium]HDD45092.1 hypothetical protein [Candidatus Desulfofervidus auxilii]
MNFPLDGRVVIIDDKFHEALPLIRVLSQKRVATTFFSGRVEELPSKPFEDVRMVFLDIVLEGLESADDKTKVSTLVNVIKRIISKKNGPFILAIWTKHPEMAEKIQKVLKNEGYYIIVANLEKDKFFRRKEKDDRDEYFEYIFEESKLNELKKKLKEQLGPVDIFKVLINWENLIHDAASKTINEVSRFTKYDDNWNNEMKKIFYNLAKAWAGRTIEDKENTDKIRSALYSFHQLFSDVFERELQRIEIEDIPLKEEDIGDDEVRGKINFRILMDSNNEEKIYPGNVYKGGNNIKQLIYDSIDRDSLISDFARSKKMNKQDILDENNKIKEEYNNDFKKFFKEIREKLKGISIPVVVEVSPICDYAQRKLKKNRYVEGFLCPSIIEVNEIPIKINEKLKRNALFLYVTPIIQYEENQYVLILDFRYFGSANDDFFKDKSFLFRIRKELLSDIQIKLSHHINRTGVLFL